MSGIAGIIRFDDAPVQPKLVKKMTNAMPYRGPDGINHWIKGAVGLGQCMLCTTPESLEEKQPLTNEDESLVLVMDGRVDNWEELRKELNTRSVRLRDRSDAELVLKAYASWGEKCLEHIDGDYAFVIWDTHKQTAFCARDRLGNKPFYYHWNGKTLVFASEAHPILDLPWIKKELNDGMIAEFLGIEWLSRDETFWLGIMRLEAATLMTANPGGLHISRYWLPNPHMALPCKNENECVEYYLDLLKRIVLQKSRSHQTLACEVSGGLDSSAIFSLANSIGNSGKLLAKDIIGYTVAFENDKYANDLKYCRTLGEYLNRKIYEIQPSFHPAHWYEYNSNRYSEFSYYPNGAMSTGLINRASLDSVVILSGSGGDEWLQGSRAYYADSITKLSYKQFAQNIKQDLAAYGILQTFKWLFEYGLVLVMPNSGRAAFDRLINLYRNRDISTNDWLAPNMYKKLELRREKIGSFPEINTSTYSQNDLVNMLYDPFAIFALEATEAMHSRNGIELRSPFMSADLVQFSFMLPESLRLRGNQSKYIHRKALKKHLPEAILKRDDKAIFYTPFRHSLDQLQRMLTYEVPSRRPEWIKSTGIDKLYSAYYSNYRYSKALWVFWSVFGCYTLSKQANIDDRW